MKPSTFFEVKDERHLTFTEPTTVYVCDPCYIFDYEIRKLSDVWQRFVDKMYEDESKGLQHAGTLEYLGATLLYTSTAHGDGCYSVQSDFPTNDPKGIGVDAGMICVISEEDALRINPRFKIASMGAKVMRFQGRVTATGTGFTGDLTVNTDDDEEED